MGSNKIPGPMDFLNDKRPNDEDQYLGRVNMKAKKMKAEGKGHKEPDNYGSKKGVNNIMYSDRGMEDTDAKKLKSQALPNTRNYSYVQ